MTAIRTEVPRREPVVLARRVLSVVLLLLGSVCATVLTWSVVSTPPASSLDALRLACDLTPLVAAFITAGFLVRAPQLTWFSGYLAVSLVGWVSGSTRIGAVISTLPGTPHWIAPTLIITSCLAFLPMAYLFPNGRFAPRWSRWMLLGWVALGALGLAFPWHAFPPAALAALTALAIGLVASLIFAQVYRYLRVSTPTERQQTKWLLLALVVHAAWLIVIMALPPGTIGAARGALGAVLAAFGALVTTALAVAIGFAMLRYRLFDVDAVIGRAVVYGALSAFILLSYVVLVGAVGLWWPAGTPLALPVAATFVAALGAAPLRRMVIRRVNRWLYGQRDEPGAVLSRLGDALSATSDLNGTLTQISTTVQSALRFPWVSTVALSGGRLISAAVVGDESNSIDSTEVSLEFEGQTVGRLVVHSRAGERVTARDRTLLESLSSPAGIAIHAALVTEELRRSQASLTEARDQERRQLHRDLHDGLGPVLSSLYQRIDLAERAVVLDPDYARDLLSGAKVGLGVALEDLRTLSDSLRPAALDRFGLVGAVAEAWSSDDRVQVDSTHDLPALPDAVEAAAYRITMEAISNSLRHSGGSRCLVTISQREGLLTIDVADDGNGFAETSESGGGLRTMRDRATELGGSFSIDDDGAGIRVRVRLPLVDAR